MASRTSQLVNKTLYQVSVAALVGVVVWVGYTVYQTLAVVPKIDIDPQILEPMSVDLNQKDLDEVAKREQLSANVDSMFAEMPVATQNASDKSILKPSEKASPIPTASGSATKR